MHTPEIDDRPPRPLLKTTRVTHARLRRLIALPAGSSLTRSIWLANEKKGYCYIFGKCVKDGMHLNRAFLTDACSIDRYTAQMSEQSSSCLPTPRVLSAHRKKNASKGTDEPLPSAFPIDTPVHAVNICGCETAQVVERLYLVNNPSVWRSLCYGFDCGVFAQPFQDCISHRFIRKSPCWSFLCPTLFSPKASHPGRGNTYAH
jgi:hypothetical protein